MKKTAVILLLLAGLSVDPARAHAPDKIDIEFNVRKSTVELYISHGVEAPGDHFVDKVDIWLNGVKKIEQNIAAQDDEMGLGLSYRIPEMKSGDKVTVKAFCSRSGDIESEAVVE